MNRRSFLSSVLKAGVAAAILPSATTYLRAQWKKLADSNLWIPNPDYETAEYEVAFISTIVVPKLEYTLRYKLKNGIVKEVKPIIMVSQWPSSD